MHLCIPPVRTQAQAMLGISAQKTVERRVGSSGRARKDFVTKMSEEEEPAEYISNNMITSQLLRPRPALVGVGVEQHEGLDFASNISRHLGSETSLVESFQNSHMLAIL